MAELSKSITLFGNMQNRLFVIPEHNVPISGQWTLTHSLGRYQTPLKT